MHTRHDYVPPDRQIIMPEVEQALTYKMFSASGRKIACASLRPGMRVKYANQFVWRVVQNSEKLKRVEFMRATHSFVHEYHLLAYNPDFKVLPPSLWYRIKKFFNR